MESSLQKANLTADDLDTSFETYEGAGETEPHIHMPGPSMWPILLSAFILVTVIGLLFVPDAPWVTLVGIPFIILGIMGWALEDPMVSPDQIVNRKPLVIPPTKEVLDNARVAAERVVTFGSTAYSVHPIKVELENETPEGVVITLYGKVELQTQRDRLEEEVRAVPGVIDVRNFVIAEDTILNNAYTRIESLRTQGKLEGANNITVLVENYILQLYGDVPDSKMKYTLEREVVGIPGVRVVVNHIGLNKDIPGNLGKTRNA
jgi:BON domain